MRRIVFDLETEPFTKEFKYADSDRIRTKLAPRMRVACAFDESRLTYSFFGPQQAAAFIRLLQSADEIVSFYGKHFDLLVLRRHYGLKGSVPRKGKHIDLCEVMSDRAAFPVSLNAAVRWNLGERKHTSGRKMGALSLGELKLACRSDVRQTYQLFQLHIGGTLQIPEKLWKKWDGDERKSFSDAPQECPSCRSMNCLEKIDWETPEMTDGQFGDYIAGTHGSAECRNCGDLIDWGF